MLSFAARILLCLRVAVLACCLVGSLTGCAYWNQPAASNADSSTDFGAKMRKPTEKGQASGFDSRAKEIEKNLGVR